MNYSDGSQKLTKILTDNGSPKLSYIMVVYGEF